MFYGTIEVECANCHWLVELEVEQGGAARDPAWTIYPKDCPECGAEWTNSQREEIEEVIMDAALVDEATSPMGESI